MRPPHGDRWLFPGDGVAVPEAYATGVMNSTGIVEETLQTNDMTAQTRTIAISLDFPTCNRAFLIVFDTAYSPGGGCSFADETGNEAAAAVYTFWSRCPVSWCGEHRFSSTVSLFSA